MTVYRSADRFVSEYQGIRSLHLYSAGAHYDPARLGFGALSSLDEHRLAPGAGFERHRHRDVDIVTWVLDGVLEHADDSGRATLVRPGDVQVQHCGTGIDHVERNASDVEPLRFLQLAFRPSAAPDAPRYELLEAVAEAVVQFGEASLQVISLAAGERHLSAGDVRTLLHVIGGSIAFGPDQASAGTDAGAVSLAAGDTVELTASDATDARLKLVAPTSSARVLLIGLS